MSRTMNITFNGKNAQINIDTVNKIIVEPKYKTVHGEHMVIFYNYNKTRAADFTLESRKGALEFANYVLNHMIRDNAKYFKPIEEVAA